MLNLEHPEVHKDEFEQDFHCLLVQQLSIKRGFIRLNYDIWWRVLFFDELSGLQPTLVTLRYASSARMYLSALSPNW